MNERRQALRRTDAMACAATLACGLFAQTAMWIDDQRVTYPVAAALLVAIALLAAWHLLSDAEVSPSTRHVVRAVKIVACAALAVTCWVTGSLAAFRPGEATVAKSVVVGSLLLLAQLVQMALVTNRRDLALGAPLVCAMLTDAGMAARDAAIAVPFALCLVCMVIATVLVHRGELLDESTAVAARPAARLFALLALVRAAILILARVCVAAALAFVLLPNSLHLGIRPAPPHSLADARPSVTQTASPGQAAAHSQAIADPADGFLDLRVRGELGKAPIFVVSASSPAYWRGNVYDNYDGARWTISETTPLTAWTIATPTAGSASAEQKAPADRDPQTGGRRQTRSDSVQIVWTQPLHVVFAPGRAISYVGAGQVQSDADGNAHLDTTTTGPPSSRYYDVTSTRAAATTATLATVPISDARGASVDSRWTQLPAELPTRVKQLATQLAATASSRPAMVAAVDGYLHSHEVYDLFSPVPAPGQDAVDDFLFVSHRGFCEQFASAAVVLLRSAGIPARLVTGYSQGDLTTDSGKRVMRAADAHAWIQVWYPGIGWVDDDPTAAATLANSALASASSSAPPSPSASPSASPSVRGVGLSGAISRMPGGRLGLAGLIVALALIVRGLVFLGRRVRWRHSAKSPPVSGGTGGPVLQAYTRLDDVLVKLGRARAPGETPRELVARLGAIATRPDDVERAVVLLERECFGIEPLTSAEVSFAAGVFDSLGAAATSTTLVPN